MKSLLAGLALLGAIFPAFAANPTIEMKTNQGTIEIELFEAEAPKSVENFLSYAKRGAYNGTIFHRVIDGFMIQGGGFDEKMTQKPTTAPIENEAKNGLKNTAGTLAMARTSDPHSATSQFFINLVDNTALDYPSRDGWGYAVFGKVTKGFDIVKKIGKVQTGNVGFHQNVPLEPVVIESVEIVKSPDAEKSKP